MSWDISTDNITDIDALWDWDALIQSGTIIFIPGAFVQSEMLQGVFLSEESIAGEID